MNASRSTPTPLDLVSAEAPPPERHWVFVDPSGRAYRVGVRAPDAPPFDTMDVREASAVVARWAEDAFAPWGARGRTLVSALVEVVAALTGEAPAWATRVEHLPWEALVATARGALEAGLRRGDLRCERLRQGVPRPELLDDLPPTLRDPGCDDG